MTSPLVFDSYWTSVEKTLFRFVFILFGLYIIIMNNGAYPFWGIVMYFPLKFLGVVIPWIGKHVLSLQYDITLPSNGSADTTFHYVMLFVIFCVALLGTVLWSMLDRKKSSHHKLYYWLTVAVRFYVGFMLIQYGMMKVIKVQFPYPDMSQLTQTYGESSPMGLAWTFLGFSNGYNLFMGIAELAAVLLLFRRTVVIGAIITLMTTANVMAVNYFYDVPVKLTSTALVLMTLFLLSFNAKTLVDLFFRGKAVQLEEPQGPVVENNMLRKGMLAGKLLLIGYVFIGAFIYAFTYSMEHPQDMASSKPPLSGVYHVNSFYIKKAGSRLKALDSARWRSLAIGEMGFVQIKYADDSTRNFRIKADTTAHTFELTNTIDYRTTDYFRYVRTDSTHFLMYGKIASDSVTIMLTINKDKRDDFLLTQRGFRWINEYPVNK